MREFRKRFWQPPRAHGEVIEDRTVSFLELFYDLIYVVVIARAAHHLAEHITWRGVGEFAVIFSLIWIGWLQGTLYYELHGREDGRTRAFVFGQMLLLALLAVFTSSAATTTGRQFALTYAVFLLLLTLFWYQVRRQDPDDYQQITGRYLTGMVISVIVITISAFLPDDQRMIVWALFVLSFVLGSLLMSRGSEMAFELGMNATDSMVERFGLFTIIVLGEVVVGVVDGMSNSDRTTITIATGMVGLMIGFSLWWTYFDFVGRRLPDQQATPLSLWILSHLPLTMSIAATGAAMVSLIEHANDSQAPVESAWLLSGAVALSLISLVFVMRTLRAYERVNSLYRSIIAGLLLGALAALLMGWLRPSPLVLTTSMVVILSIVWLAAVLQWLSMSNPDDALPQASDAT